MLEDDVIGLFADRLRDLGFYVLAAGASQGSAFRFHVDSCWKAPDIVAERRGRLFVGEGKILARDIFRRSKRGFSDYDAMNVLAQSDEMQARVKSEACAKMRTFGQYRSIEDLCLFTGVVASDTFEKWRDIMTANGVLSFVADPSARITKRCLPTTSGWIGYKALGF